MASSNGSFVWYELMTSDLAGAERFYAAVAGWDIIDADIPGIAYRIARVGDRPVAGLMGFPPDTGPGPLTWFGYIGVGDVDTETERLKQAGGGVHRPPTDIPGVGRFAVVTDPQGAVFMLFRGAGEPPPELAPKTPGTFGWRELFTSDAESAFAFYEGLFGWEKSYAHDMGSFGVYQTFSVGGEWTGGMMRSTEAPRPYWRYYINVDDIDAASRRVKEAGGTVTGGPHEVPGGSWVLMGTDPQGAAFHLTGPRLA